MNKIKTAKKFVSDHRVSIAVGATSTVFIYLGMKQGKQMNDFLEANNLLDAYYNPVEA